MKGLDGALAGLQLHSNTLIYNDYLKQQKILLLTLLLKHFTIANFLFILQYNNIA